jgi:hypothetical protein
MAIEERITSYTASIAQTNYLSHTRTIRLALEFGSNVYIGFPEIVPADWLTFGDHSITMYLPAAEYDHVYHLLQTEKPVYCTALDLFGLQIGAVHTQLDLTLGEPTGEGYQDQSLEALVVRAKASASQA